MNIKSNNQFNVIPSHVGLRKYILFYNVILPGTVIFAEHYTLMPNACGTLSLAFDGNIILAEVWGASVTPTLLGAEPNQYRVLVLIQLSPYGLYQITRRGQAEFTDKRVSLKDVDSDLFNSLKHAFVRAESVTDLVTACDTILYRRMEKHVVSDVILHATQVIENHHGQIQVREAARQTGYSERHLNRLFHEQIGTNIKNYARLVRFNYVLKHIQKSQCSFAAVSQQTGYFDQAHFDKDFKSISGVTPQIYLEKMSDFYYDGTEIVDILSL